MKRILYTIVLLLLVSTACDTESSIDPVFEDYFLKYYGTEGNQEGVDLVSLSDGGFLLLGSSQTIGGNSQILVVRTDVLGNEVWSNLYGGQFNEFPTDIELESNGNVLISANVDEGTSSGTDVLFLRLNQEGIVLDSAIFGLPNVSETINSLTLVSDGDIIGVGTTTAVDTQKPSYDPATDLEDFYSIRITNSFVQLEPFQWKQVVGYPGRDRGQKIIEQENGRFLMFGTSDDPNSNSQQEGFNMILFATNDLGDIVSFPEVQYYGTLGDELAAQITETIDGGYSMIGTSIQESAGSSMFSTRVRSNIDFVNSSIINVVPDIVATAVTNSLSGGFFQLGVSNASVSGNILLVKTNDAGAIEWSREFGGLDSDSAGKIIQLLDGSLAIIGSIELESQKKMALIKTNRMGEFNSN